MSSFLNMIVSRALVSVLFMSASAYGNASWWDKAKELVKDTPLEDIAAPANVGGSSLSNTDITAAFKQALELGSQKVVNQLGTVDGFNKDATVRIPMPQSLQAVSGALKSVGLGYMVDDFTLRLNRAAEQATPEAKALFVDTIKGMKFDDVRRIYNGPEDSATRFFEERMTPDLTKAMEPIISDSLSQVGAVAYYDKMISAYKNIPFVPDVKSDLISHVSEGALDGVFHYLAEQEAAIRQDPVRQTTILLKKVFGQQ